MVLIGAKNQRDLEKIAQHLEVNDIKYVMFHETDVDEHGVPAGYTAICTAPIHGETRKKLRKFQIY